MESLYTISTYSRDTTVKGNFNNQNLISELTQAKKSRAEGYR